MPGLSDLLRNPRRLQQFAETPGNYPAALSFAGTSQSRVGRRASPRASQNEEEAGVLETGEVIDKVKLPDGSYVAPATQSGQIVKVPGRSNLFVDPVTGEPFQADPTKPTGLRSAYDAARRVARGGKEYAVIPGIGEKEIGPDQKALAKQAEEEQKAKYDLQAEEYYKQNRPFRFRPGSHEPIPRHTDEEWQALQKKKAEEALSEAHVKKLKAQADRLELDAKVISINAPKVSKEDEEAYNSAVSSLESFASGKDLDTAAEELANAPDSEDEDQNAAKATAQSYLSLRDKVKPAKDAEAKAKELELRSIDLKKQMLDPDAWKAGKAASLAELPDADLAAEAQAQADIITEQETEANGTLELVAKGRADLEQKHAAFMAERQAAEAQGLSLEQKQALDDQQAQLEAEMADYDDWNAEAVTSAQGALKASQDRREVLAAAGAEMDRRNNQWARPLEGKWGEMQKQMVEEAKAAGIPAPSSRSSDSPGRALMVEAFDRLDRMGIQQPRFIGQPGEPEGDRTAGKDLESLIDGLNKAEQQATTPEAKAKIAKERAYWQTQAQDAMTAEDWTSQTGEPDLLYPHEKAAVLEKAKPLYDTWAKEMYSDDWTKEDFLRLNQEAAKHGLDPAQAKQALQTYRQLDWSNPHRDPETAKPIAEVSRLLPDGRVTINPGAWGDVNAYTKAVEASGASEEGKKQALEQFPQLQEIYAEKAVEVLSKSANIPGQDNFMKWRERKIEEDQAQKGALGFTRKSPARQAIEYMDEMKNRSWFRKAGEQIVSGLLVGSADIATQVLGDAAMLTGSETIADLAAANSANSESVVGAQSLEGSDTDYALRVMGMGARITPGVAAMMAGAGALGGGMTAVSILSGAQTAGGMFADIYRKAKDEGLTHGEAWRKAALPSAFAGMITGLLTKGMGATGLERIFADPVAKEAAKGAFKAYLGQFAKGAAEELPEETADEFFSQVVQGAAESADPVETLKAYAENLPELAGVTSLMGGAGGLMQGKGKGPAAGPDGMAPMPGEPQAPQAPAPMPGPVGPAQISQPAQTGDIAGAIKAFTPTGEAMLPQAVADTVKRTNRTTEDVSRAAASGLVKVAQGASLESLDAREREALGFVSKDGKIIPAPKTTPLVETYKGKLVIRNEAAEWLDDEGQPLLARQIRLDEAERKAQIDEAEAKPAAKKKAGQAKPKAAESQSQGSETVITGDSLSSEASSTLAPATISGATEAPKSSQTITGSNAEMAAEMPVQPATAGEAPAPTPKPAPANEPQPQTAVSPEPSRGPVMPESRELPVVPEQPPAPAQETAPEPEPAAGGGLTPAQQDQLARAETAHKKRVETITKMEADPEQRAKQLKAEGMKHAAVKRQITGKLTAKEQAVQAKREASNYEGKPVAVEGRPAVVTGNAFGKVKVRFEDGTTKAVPASQVTARQETPPAPVDEAAAQAATSPASPAPEPSEAQKEAGNYKKGHAKIGGLDISIENEAGTKRRPEWGALSDHYGYIKGTVDNTGEHADVFIKPGTPEDYAGPVFVVTQNDPKTGKFDEFKTIIGYDTAAEAELAYRANYTADWQGFGGIQEMSLDEFKAGLADMTAREKAAREPGQPVSQAGQAVSEAAQAKAKASQQIPQASVPVSEQYMVQMNRLLRKKKTAMIAGNGDLVDSLEEQIEKLRATVPIPSAQAPATPLAKAKAAIAGYTAKAIAEKKAAKDDEAKKAANRKIVGAAWLAKRLEAFDGVVDYAVATEYNGKPISGMMVIPAGRGGLFVINPAGAIDQLAENNLGKEALYKAIDKFLVHEFIHQAALSRLNDKRILDLYNALTPEAKAASRRLYLAQAGESQGDLDEFQAAHEWFAQLVEARMSGEISNQALIEASDDPAFRDKLAALFREFVAALRDIAGLVKDPAMAEQIRAEADAVEAAVRQMAEKAGLAERQAPAQPAEQAAQASQPAETTKAGIPSLGDTGKAIWQGWKNMIGINVMPGESVVGVDVHNGGQYFWSGEELMRSTTNAKQGYALSRPATKAEIEGLHDSIDRGGLQIESRVNTGATGMFPKVDGGKTTRVIHQATGKPLAEFLKTPAGKKWSERDAETQAIIAKLHASQPEPSLPASVTPAQAEAEPADIGPATPTPLPADEGGQPGLGSPPMTENMRVGAEMIRNGAKIIPNPFYTGETKGPLAPLAAAPSMEDVRDMLQPGLANPPGQPGPARQSDEAQDAELEEAANEAVREAGEILRELQQQGEQEARAKAKDEAARLALANDPKAVRAIGEGEKIDARNPSLIFKNPAARRFYQAILVARAELGMRTYISDKELQDFARKQFDSDPEGVYEWALDKADEGESLNDEEQAVLFELFDRAQADDSPFINRPGFDQEMVKLGHYIRESRGTTGRMLRYGRDRVETPQQRWKRAFYHIKGPDPKQAAMLRIAPSAREKARRIAELEDQLSKASATRRADIEAALAKAKRQKSRAEVLEEITAENERLMDIIIDKMGGVTRDDIMHSPLERYGAQIAVLDLPAVREALDKFDNGRDIMLLSFRGFSTQHIAGALQIPEGDVADFIKQANAAIVRPAVTEQVKAGKTFGDWIKSGLDILARKTGLRQPPSIRPLENWRTLMTGKRQTLDEVTAEVNRVMNYVQQSQKARDSKKLMSKVINTPTGQRVRIFVPFDPDDAANYYSFAREYSAAKANVFDKFYEYWINWPLLSGPQTQVVNFTGNAAQVAWHYTGQRLAEATLNALIYHDPNSAQLREFWHIIKGFWKSIGPALDMARQSFLTEGDTVRHKYLNEPLQIDVVDGDIDKVGGIRAAVGGKLGRLNRLPGRVLRWTDSFFKTAVLYAEASAVAYRKAHASAKAQGLKGQARRDFIDTEIDNTLKDPQSPVWADVMDTAEELLFQDDNVATAIVDTMLGGYRGVNAFEKALAEAKASGNSKTVAVLNAMIAGAKAVNRIMRFIFPFQRTPTNIIRVGLRKGGGSAIVGLYHLLHGGWLKYKYGTPMLESYTKAMQIKDLSETGIAVMGWLMLASMFEGDDDDEKKPFLIVGSRPSSRQGYPEKQAFLNKYGGESSFVWQDGKGNVIASKSFGRYEPIGTLLTTWVDAYRNFQEVRRRQKAGEAASFKTYMLSSFVSGLENKSFLQGLSNVMEWIRDIEERRENPDVDANTKLFLRNVIPNIIKQPLRNWDDVVRETKTAGAGYSALPNPAAAPKLPTFAAEPKISTTGQKMRKDLSAPARLLFPANTVVTPQPDALLYRANRLNPTAAKWPSGIQRDEFFYRAPGAKPKTPGYHVPIENPAEKRRFAEIVGQEYTKEVRNYVASLPPALKARPGPDQIEGLTKAMTEARKKARILYGLQKPKTPAITTSNK